MSRFERALLWASTGLVSVSGSVYGFMKYLLTSADPYAVINHPAQPFFLKLHILSAPALVFAVGLIYTAHVWANWKSRKAHGRRSGVAVWVALVPLIASGYLLETFTNRTALRVLLAVHLASAGVFLVGIAGHQLVAWRTRRSQAASKVLSLRKAMLVAALLLSACAARAGDVTVERRWVVMGTYATVTLIAPDEASAEEAIAAIQHAFERVDDSMSNWKDTSELSVLNRAAGRSPYRVQDADLFRCVTLALDWSRITGGAFDPTVGPLMRLYGFRPHAPRVPAAPEIAEAERHVGWRKVTLDPATRSVRFSDPQVEVDLGGIAKGYALDLAVARIAQSRARAALVDLGGELYAWRHVPGGDRFRIGIRDPSDGTKLLGSVPLEDRAASTSANYENSFRSGGRVFGHLMDPGTGAPVESDVVSATVLAERATAADALSTALLVAGSKRAAEIVARTPGVEAVLVVRSGTGLAVVASRSLEGSLELEPGLAGHVRYALPRAAQMRETRRFGPP